MLVPSANLNKRGIGTPLNEEDMVIGEHQSSDDESVNGAEIPKEIHLKGNSFKSVKTI